ncbi:MAG: hypothetical protein JSU94_02585 [Phycisphaerales bacterium]|nr:MAG: hypothetical protein JSU94_02585 [Phycisphaerales bacterium]
MDIQKKENWNSMFWAVVWVALALMACSVCPADTDTAARVLKATYGRDATVEIAQAGAVVESLEAAMADCNDDYLVSRIKYRIGVIYFRCNLLKEAKGAFLKLTDDPKCTEVISVCSLNMAGQISRMQGDNEAALDAFGKMVKLCSKHLSDADDKSPYARLMCAGLFGMGEIYELQQDYGPSIARYTALLKAIPQIEGQETSNLPALVRDRISQLYLRQGQTDKYLEQAKELISRHQDYYRTPVIEYEAECVQLLRGKPGSPEFRNGSYVAPAEVVASLKDPDNEATLRKLSDKLGNLCEEHKGTYGGILLGYHYAWLLETLGEKAGAAQILEQIASANVSARNGQGPAQAVVDTLQEYSKIQFAILAAEKADYGKALRMLSSLREHAEKSHISTLLLSVNQSIETLRREVPTNENEKK